MAFPHSAEQTKAACVAALQRLRTGDGAPMAAWLRTHLFGHVLPFWEGHALDPAGGLLTCIEDDGRVSSTDKWLWSQWRAVWMFSRLHRSLDPNGKWLEHARSIARFCIEHGWDQRTRHWVLLLAQDGTVLRGYESIHVDAFAVQALAELHLASGESEYLELALATADSALDELAKPPDTIPHFPYPIPRGAKPHAIPMMWSLVLAELGAAAGIPRYRRAAEKFSREIFEQFYRPARNLCLEFLQPDGSEYPPPIGTTVVPGHAIEDMWFQLHVGNILRDGAARRQLACELIARHLEVGWDDETGGGIALAIDAEGRQPVAWKFADAKLWWPHTEALYATLLGWKLEQSAPLLEWYERLWRFCLDHYVDWENGEWRQKLNRELAPLMETVALPVKDPFHLVRSLILQIELLGRTGGFQPEPFRCVDVPLMTSPPGSAPGHGGPRSAMPDASSMNPVQADLPQRPD